LRLVLASGRAQEAVEEGTRMDMMERCRARCGMRGRRWLHHELAFGVFATYTIMSRKAAPHDTHASACFKQRGARPSRPGAPASIN
jgi:hypothetical protein